MNIIVVSRRLSSPRTLNLKDRRVWMPLAAVGSGVTLVIMGIGLALGIWLGRLPQAEELQALERAQAEQAAQLESVRESANAHMNGLALRLGEMQASVMRLNALGQRLVKKADLEGGEFDFDQVPALGGPEDVLSAPAIEIPGFATAVEDLEKKLKNQHQQLSVLEQLMTNRQIEDRQEPAGRPVESGWLSSSYGTRIDPFTGNKAWHSGIDFAGREGSEVRSVADGVVIWSGTRHGYGQLVEVDHGNGYATRYGHNSENLVQVGDRVHKGQAVARMGDTGRATAPNVHFEVLQQGKTVNPYRFVKNMQ